MRLIFGFIPLCLLLLTGCDRSGLEVTDESDEAQYRRGQSLLREGRQQEALEAFLKVIENRSDAAESHLEAGRLYLDHVNDPVSAIYHFRQFLTLRPNAEQAPFIKDLIDTGKKEFVRSLPGQPNSSLQERVNLLDQVERLRAENLELKQSLAVMNDEVNRLRTELGLVDRRNARIASPSVSETVQTLRPLDESRPDIPPDPRNYSVQEGDTLSRISQRFYGTNGRWREIFEANRDQLNSPNDLRPGQTLTIP